MIPQGPEMYLMLAKEKRHDQKWVKLCARNRRRVLLKQMAAVAPATVPSTYENYHGNYSTGG